ncbi:hypothetical protein LINPERHAP1_LOCUS21759, partial [Linum perenne]
ISRASSNHINCCICLQLRERVRIGREYEFLCIRL